MNIEMLQYSGVVTVLFVSGCCFVTFFTRKSALEAQNALHNIKTLAGVSPKHKLATTLCHSVVTFWWP
jgi:pseudouridine-5'-phosphate glycosidase